MPDNFTHLWQVEVSSYFLAQTLQTHANSLEHRCRHFSFVFIRTEVIVCYNLVSQNLWVNTVFVRKVCSHTSHTCTLLVSVIIQNSHAMWHMVSCFVTRVVKRYIFKNYKYCNFLPGTGRFHRTTFYKRKSPCENCWQHVLGIIPKGTLAWKEMLLLNILNVHFHCFEHHRQNSSSLLC